MSVVAIKIEKDKIVIGADSIIVSGWTQEKDKLAKLNRINGMVIGDVGDAQEGGLFLLYCKTRKPSEASVGGLVEFMSEFQGWMTNKIGETVLNNQYIIVLDGKAFVMEGYYIKEVTDYTAIGAGMDFSLAALYLGNSVEDSIKASCHLSVYCEEPVNLIEIEK